MSGQVRVIADGGDVVVDVGVHVRLALLVIGAALHDVEEMRDDTAGGKALAVVVEVKTPRIGKATSEHFEFLLGRMPAPDAGVDKGSL